jgi:hypothetical protein
MLNEMNNKVNELAEKVIPNEWLQSFLRLSLKDKLVGIGTFAQIAGDPKMVEFSLKSIKYIDAK